MKNRTLLRLRKSIFAKFTLSFITVGLIPLLVLSYISLNTFSNYMEKYVVNNFEQMLLFAGKNVDDMYMKYNNISKLMYSYGVGGMYGQLGEAIAAQNLEVDTNSVKIVDNFLLTALYTDIHLQSVFFVYPNGNFQSLNKEKKPLDFDYDYPNKEWRNALLQNRNQLTYFPTHPESYYLGSNAQVLTFGRNLIDVLGAKGLEGRIVGTFFMDIGLGAFDEIFNQMMLNPKDVIYVLDHNNTVLYSNNKAYIGSTYTQKESSDYLYRQQDNANVSWKIVGELYKEEMFQKIEQIIGTITIVIGLCMVSLIMVAVWFSKRFSKPIRSITIEMAKVESGNFDTQVTVQSVDELGLLSRGFNKMVVRLQDYINEVYVAQIKQKQAELNALKSQIRPHYLYNTLEVIRMSAVANDDNEVGDMILSLSHQLKYVLDYGQETVTLQEEKTNIEQYFRLMELRYGEHKLAMDFRYEGDVLGCVLPKLSIQPIVENAVYHGIMPKSGKGTIRVIAEKLSDHLLSVTVDDDGIGMSEETLQQVRQKLENSYSAESGSSSIGLKNVHDRIVTLYGADYGIEITSSKDIGTSVRMVIPLGQEVITYAERHPSR
ncbi:MAG: putative sensor with domain [Paenibacillus sp.]|nr:putative sensor with domain [Paenibacillus sp.]